MVHGSSIVYIPYLHLRKGVLDSNFIICDIYIKIKHYFYFLPNTVYITYMYMYCTSTFSCSYIKIITSTFCRSSCVCVVSLFPIQTFCINYSKSSCKTLCRCIKFCLLLCRFLQPRMVCITFCKLCY